MNSNNNNPSTASSSHHGSSDEDEDEDVVLRNLVPTREQTVRGCCIPCGGDLKKRAKLANHHELFHIASDHR
jgi:hypothetical protein